MDLNDMATKKHILLTPRNIQTLESLWYETNSRSRLSHNQILGAYSYIRREYKGKKQAGRRGEPLVISTAESIKSNGMKEPQTKEN